MSEIDINIPFPIRIPSSAPSSSSLSNEGSWNGERVEARVQELKKKAKGTKRINGTLKFGGACSCCRGSKTKCDGQPRCSRCTKYGKVCEYTNPKRRTSSSSSNPNAASSSPDKHLAIPSHLSRISSHPRRPLPSVLVKFERRSPSLPLSPPISETGTSYTQHPHAQWGHVSLYPYPGRLSREQQHRQQQQPSPPSSSSTLHAYHSVPSQRRSPPFSQNQRHRHLPYDRHTLTLAPILGPRGKQLTRLPSPTRLFPDLLAEQPRLQPKKEEVSPGWGGEGGRTLRWVLGI